MDITILPAQDDCGTLQMIGQLWDPDEIKVFREKMDDMQREGVTKIVVDLSRVSFATGQGIGAMVRLVASLSSQDILVILYKPVGCVKELIEISGLDMVMKIAATEQDLATMLRQKS